MILYTADLWMKQSWNSSLLLARNTPEQRWVQWTVVRVFSIVSCDLIPKCALKSKDISVKAAAVDTKWDEKSIFNIFSGSARAHGLSANWIRLVAHIFPFHSKKINLLYEIVVIVQQLRQKEGGWTAISVSPRRWPLQAIKKQELMLLRGDWLKEEHGIKINSCTAMLK